jgi:hypothetical protein
VSEPERLRNITEVQEILGIGATLAREIVGKPGGIPAVRVGRCLRVRPCDLEAWIAAHVEGGQDNSASTGWTPALAHTGGQGNGRQRRVS